MSWIDDQIAEREAAIRNAKARVAHGKHFPARQFAEGISVFRTMLLKEYGSLEQALDRLLTFEVLKLVSEPGFGMYYLAQSLDCNCWRSH